ncbi:MAG: HypC/HybG/HupF family hydrogenase formation chaperone [Nitrospirae bacterium]|nr:MAG: HypC/HybG/HupF family hydrogenase formation chaperone [Nitrospirota bacterium]
MCLAIPGQIQYIDDDELRTGLVSFGGISQEVCLALVPEAKVGDFVIVHVGFAISRVNEEAARETLKLWETTQHSPHSREEPSSS